MAKAIIFTIWSGLIGLALTSLVYTALLVQHGLLAEIPVPLICGFFFFLSAAALRKTWTGFQNSLVTTIPAELRRS